MKDVRSGGKFSDTFERVTIRVTEYLNTLIRVCIELIYLIR